MVDMPGEKAFIEYVKNTHNIGFGNMMSIVSRIWYEKDPVGSLTVGPCYKQVEVYGGYFDLVDKVEKLKKENNELRRGWQNLIDEVNPELKKIVTLIQGGHQNGDRNH